MKSGDLREPIVIQQYTVIPDNKGNRPKSWVTMVDCLAKVNDVSGRDFYEAQAQQALDTVTFTIRWRDDVNTVYQKDRTKLRIVHQGLFHEVLHLNRLEFQRDFMRIKARTQQPVGDA